MSKFISLIEHSGDLVFINVNDIKSLTFMEDSLDYSFLTIRIVFNDKHTEFVSVNRHSPEYLSMIKLVPGYA